MNADPFLLDVPVHLSPRLKWMERHDVEVTCLSEGTTEREWQVNGRKDTSLRYHLRCFAADEAGALIEWAHHFSIPLWHQP